MINRDRIVRNIVSKFKEIGIDKEVNGEPSHTAKLVEAIVNEIIKEITTYGEVQNIQVTTRGVASQPGSLEIHTGEGNGVSGVIT